ncbi:MAG: Maf family nucleotide pyrophosphatase [Phycisphaerae bacterium]|nr:Maf family nucleotide pyrophosphatase [Phycisphaerae bacterium]
MSAPLVLASASPRRRELLCDAGFDPQVLPSDIDDAILQRRMGSPEAFVTALSWFKVSRVVANHALRDAVVLGADTVCMDGSHMLGKPRDRRHAEQMLRSLQGRSHRVVTGVTIVGVDGTRHLFVDVATVEFGNISDALIDEYVRSDAWRGKAGGYNFSERLNAGWPLRCDGDPTGVMGLPMQRTVPLLVQLGAHRERQSRLRPMHGERSG